MTTSTTTLPLLIRKYCPGCERTPPLTAFERDRSRRDGLQRLCRDCIARRDAVRWRSEPVPPVRLTPAELAEHKRRQQAAYYRVNPDYYK